MLAANQHKHTYQFWLCGSQGNKPFNGINNMLLGILQATADFLILLLINSVPAQSMPAHCSHIHVIMQRFSTCFQTSKIRLGQVAQGTSNLAPRPAALTFYCGSFMPFCFPVM